MPAQPKGEMRKSARNERPFVVSKVGAGVGARRMGMKAKDTSTDGITKSTKPEGSPTFRMAWLAMMPTICTIM